MTAPGRASFLALWGFAGWLLPLLVVFLLAPRLLYLLGPERFGILMIVLVTPAVASQVDFGLGVSAVRRLAVDLSRGKIDGSRTLYSYTVAFCAIALLFGTTVALSSRWLADTLGFSSLLGADAARQLILGCALWGAVGLVTAIPFVVARAAQSLVWITAVQTIATVVLWISALLLVSAGHPLRDIVVLGILVSFVSAAVMAFAVRGSVKCDGPLTLQTSIPAQDIGFAGGMFAAQLASTIVYQLDRILISSIGSPAIAGAYALCANVANKPLAAVVALTSFAFPRASGLHPTDANDQLGLLLQALDRAIAVLVIPLLVPALWLAEPFLKLWLGGYGTPELALAFQMLLIAFAIPAFAVPVSHVLAATGRSRLAAQFAWLTAGVTVTGVVMLVPRYGLVGAAAAIMAGMSTSLAFSIFARRALEVAKPRGQWRFWTGITLGATMQATVTFVLARLVFNWWTLLLVGFTVWAVFFLARVIFRMLSPEEVRLLDRLRKISSFTVRKR